MNRIIDWNQVSEPLIFGWLVRRRGRGAGMSASTVESGPRSASHERLRQPAGSAGARGLWPGLALAAAIAGLAFSLRQIPGVATLSPMILAILLGIAFHNVVGTPARAKPGIAFSMKRVLRFAVAMLGLQLTLQQIAAV